MQVRNLDADVQERLRRAAENEGISLSAFLRGKLTELARDLDVQERLHGANAAQRALGGPLHGLEHLSSDDIVRIIHEGRDER